MRIGKLLAAIFGGLILLGGTALTTGGAIVMAVTDGDGWVTAPTARIETETAAVVGANIDVDLGEAIDERTFVDFGNIPARIEAESRSGKDVFIGIAPHDDISAYVGGIAHVRADVFEDNVDLFTADGGGELPVPTEQTIWVSSSTDGRLDWDLESGTWSVVVANVDGSPGIDVAVTGSARIPFVEAIGIGMLVVGVLAIVGGAVMLYFGVRADPYRPVPGAAASSPVDSPAPQEPQIVS